MSFALLAPTGSWASSAFLLCQGKGLLFHGSGLHQDTVFVFFFGCGMGKGGTRSSKLYIPSIPRVHWKMSLFHSVVLAKLQPLTGFMWVPCFPLSEALGSGRCKAAIGQA